MAFSMSACGKTGNAQNGTTSVDTTDESGNAVSVDTASYTYNDYAPGSPATWNPHEWETDQDSYIISYTTSNLYEFDLNDTNDGYKVVCEMASDFPVDVTSDYAGNETYGVPSDAKEGYAWKIELNPAAKWEDGTPITADDYIYSMQQLLNSDMQNYRASSFYDGTHALANAQALQAQEKEVYTPVYDSAISDYRDVKDSDMVFSLTQSVVSLAIRGQIIITRMIISHILMMPMEMICMQNIPQKTIGRLPMRQRLIFLRLLQILEIPGMWHIRSSVSRMMVQVLLLIFHQLA